jgi:two-component system nitrogen regulation sensor histidine kinase NtrY
MDYNRFSITILLHVVLITMAAMLFAFCLVIRQQYATAALFGVIILLLLWRTFHLFNRTNRILSGFLDYLRDNDPALEFSAKFVRKRFGELENKLRIIIEEVREKRIEEEMHARYLQMVVDHMDAGILIIGQNGRIETMNRMARKYLGDVELRTTKDLDKVGRDLSGRIERLKPGRSFIEKLSRGADIQVLSLKKAVLGLRGIPYEIISLNDIRTELEDQELESWKKLVRVITHEIMNSITPITTLTAAIRKKFSNLPVNAGMHSILPKDLQTGLESVDIIEERSNGLISFIEKYQKLTRIPPIKLTVVEIKQLFEGIEFLFKEQLNEKKITFFIHAEQVHRVKADKDLMEQVLINLIKNAIEALDDTRMPEIHLQSYMDPAGQVIIEVRDNGCGIPPEDLDHIFVPFYSTKKEGSGIGLSFCRQVIHLHKAQLTVSSKPGTGTAFRIIF